ncbi:MAG: hypothetical protein ABSE73_05790 [Planctomycetota bacterium]
MKRLWLLPAGALVLSGFTALWAAHTALAAEGIRQPVFLLCPLKKKYSAWSLYLILDRADPGKVLALGLEKLKGKNAEDLAPNGYEAVLAAQKDPQTAREPLGTLEAKDFARGELRIEEDDALRVSLDALGPDSYRLNVSLRVGADTRFVIGGKERAKREVVLRLDRAKGQWAAYAVTLENFQGKKVVQAGVKTMSGIGFPVLGSGIPRIIGDVEGQAVTLMDSSEDRHGD